VRGGTIVIEWVFALARMLGLGAAAGTRPWLTLAALGLVANLRWGADVTDRFEWLGHPAAIIIFILLALLEATLDKISKVDRLQDRLAMPLRLAAGAVAGAATVGQGWQGLFAGLAVGGFAAWVAQHVKHERRPRSTLSEATVPLLSLVEDLYAFVGTIATLFWSPLGFAVFAWPAALWAQLRERRRAKYRALHRGRT
jgi:uncharacterized membrane protein